MPAAGYFGQRNARLLSGAGPAARCATPNPCGLNKANDRHRVVLMSPPRIASLHRPRPCQSACCEERARARAMDRRAELAGCYRGATTGTRGLKHAERCLIFLQLIPACAMF